MGRLWESLDVESVMSLPAYYSAQEVADILQFWNAESTVWRVWQKSPVDSLVCWQLVHTQSIRCR